MDTTKLKSVAEKAMNEPNKNFVIDIPEMKAEYPSLATEKSRVFPLPLSYENQCTIMGAANNLALFSEEFNFPSNSVKKYIPLKTGKSEFNLDAAYERFSFMKSLARHRERQERYENILREREQEVSESDFVIGI